MIHVDFDALNPLERRIHGLLAKHAETAPTIRIKHAAELCGCSVSKISKLAKKLGFSSYKQYVDFLCGVDLPTSEASTEIDRLRRFLDGFDRTMVDDLVELIQRHEKLLLLGSGPSLLCAQYFEYRLMTCTDKVTIATQDDLIAASNTDDKTLLLILTVTGSFRSYEKIYRDTKAKGGDVAVLIEEYHPFLIRQFDKVFCLTNEAQPDDLHPHEKTRTAFFIFMEEVIRELRSQAS